MTRPSNMGDMVRATLNFFSHTSDGAVPYSTFGPQQARPSGPASNIVTSPHLVGLHDVRGHEEDFDLDVQGFLPVRGVDSLTTDLVDANECIQDVVGGTYDLVKSHMEAIVRRVLPSSKAMSIFTVMTRSSNPHDSTKGQRRPSPLIHIDHTPTSGLSFVAHLPEHIQEDVQAGRLRVRILSVWQPLVSEVLDWPLAMADVRTCSLTSFLESETRLAHGKTGAMSLMTHDPKAEWWYWSTMTDTEVLVIKNFDSNDSHGCTPHTSFLDLRVASTSGAYRRSIEARVVVASTV